MEQVALNLDLSIVGYTHFTQNTYLRLVFGLVKIPNFQQVYIQKYIEPRYEIFVQYPSICPRSTLKISDLETIQKKIWERKCQDDQFERAKPQNHLTMIPNVMNQIPKQHKNIRIISPHLQNFFISEYEVTSMKPCIQPISLTIIWKSMHINVIGFSERVD